MYSYLPQVYQERINRLYGRRKGDIEDRVLFLYKRVNENWFTSDKIDSDKPLIVDIFTPSISNYNYEELVLKHPLWKSNMKKFLPPDETIEIPYAVNPRAMEYLPFGIWIDEYVLYIEWELLKTRLSIEEIISLLEAKGTFLIISKPLNEEIELGILENLLWKKIAKRRIVLT